MDTQVRVEGNNMISFKYYEKPTVTNVMVQKRSAMGENSKVQILANEMMRRLGNTDQRQGKNINKEVVDGFAKKLLTSGYDRNQTRRIIISGIRGWERRMARAKAEGRKTHRKAVQSAPGRIKKKILGKTEWFKKKKKKEEEDNIKEISPGSPKQRKGWSKKRKKTTPPPRRMLSRLEQSCLLRTLRRGSWLGG